MTEFQLSLSRAEDGKFQLSEVEDVTPWPVDQELAVVGKPHPRLEGREKVTGRAQYSYDVRLPGQLYAAVLRSPYPHARIKRIDTTAAEALPGVHAVLSSANAPEIPWYQDSLLFDTTVRYVGDEVAAVAAETSDLAQDALKLIEVEYEPLPFVTDLVAALAPDAPKVRESGNIKDPPTIYERGNVADGFAEADGTVEAVYTTHAALHNALEPHGCTASWEGDSLTLWDSTQSVFTIRQEVAEKLGLPEHNVRVIKQHMGGGFGAKQVSWKPDVIAPLLSRLAGRPVQLMVDRRAENLSSGNRNPTRQHVRLGAKRDGTLTAIFCRSDQATGAYMVGGEASDVSGMYQTLYRCTNVRTEQYVVFTNTGPAVAFRAPGHVEAAWALEQAMDELARKLDMDPVELRRRNYTETDQMAGKPFSLPEGLRLCYDRVTEAFGWETYQKPPTPGTKRRGIGFAAHDWGGGAGHPPGYAWAKLNEDGSLDVITGTQDIGTVTRTGLAQIAAEELGVPLERVTLRLGDTGTGPYSPTSAGSATQATLGPAIRAAVAEVRRQLLAVASALMDVNADRLSIRDGLVMIDGQLTGSMTVEDIARSIAPHNLLGSGARGPNPEDVTVRTFGAQIAEVEIDTETGEVTVLRVVTAHDIGRIVNPTMVESQVIGGITQGVGFALTEARIEDHRLGRVMNANLEEYKVPTIADVPQIEHIPVDVPDVHANSTGAKGVGEPPLVPTAPAIANAIYDAIGIRCHESPVSRHQILDAIARRDAQEAGGARA
jgi:xanthine dehydrogenase YagR molybdenum-binding subunit